jgi:hypothetical protein
LPNEGKGRKNGPVEIYQARHYLTITGHRLEGYPATIETRSDAVESFYNKYFGQSGTINSKSQLPNTLCTKTGPNDDEIIALVTNAANGDKFKKLIDGEIGDYKSASEADAALCCIIAFYTRDRAQIERIWGKSGLAQREKYQRGDYRSRTIQKALETVREHYSGDGSKASQPTCKTKTKRSISTKLLELAQNNGCELWHTPDNEPYVSFTIDGHRESHPLKNRAVKRWLGLLLYGEEEKAAGSQAMQDAINILEAEAVYKGPEYDAYVRVGEHDRSIFVDLCDDKWRAIEIDKSGWRVVALPLIRFIRSKGMLALPEPIENGSLEELKPLLNMNDEKTWILVKAVMVGALNPSGPYPVVIFSGEQGSAKSTTQRIIRNLIDPNEAPLRRPPKDERDLMIAARNSWIISFDNLSGIRNDLSDALCSISTGGALTTRELYSDTEETLLSARRPVFLNGIDSIQSRHDLLDRALIINLTALKEDDRKTEKEIMDEFNRIRPRVLGALYNAVSLGLKNLPTIKLAKKPRMADFAIWVTACEEGLECKPGDFLKAFARAADEAILDTISSDSLAQIIINIAKYNKPAWSGTATQLLDKINILS